MEQAKRKLYRVVLMRQDGTEQSFGRWSDWADASCQQEQKQAEYPQMQVLIKEEWGF
jgi:hypothetical protein